MTTAATHHPSLRSEPCNLIGGRMHPIPGRAIHSHNPARPDHIIWSGDADPGAVPDAVAAARSALREWSQIPIEKRIEALLAYKAIVTERESAIADLICDETGKALWDSQAEAKLLAAKVDITLSTDPHSGRSRITPFDVPIRDGLKGVCAFRPHGVMAVLGPFNFPAHLPNGHIVPALLAGNTIVFKPSDKAPAVGQLLAELLIEALDAVGAPPGVVNLLQGGADVASSLVKHPGLDGILFTGSWPVARRILEANLDHPGRMIALELGGNNPAVVMPDADLRQTVIECARAAFVTTGQRCTCTRRLILHKDIAHTVIPALQKIASNMIIGDPRGIGGGSRNQPVFMGPIIRDEARRAVIDFQKRAAASGATTLLESTAPDHALGGHYITPGILLVDRFTLNDSITDPGCDTEVFGPLLRIAITDSLDDAIEQANATKYGLAASVFTRDEHTARRFLAEVRAGCINVNSGTAGASGKLPFGGLGHSGNHRPAGAFSLDYCAYPVASMIEEGANAPLLPGMTFEDEWLSVRS